MPPTATDPLALTVHSGPAPVLPRSGTSARTGGRFTALLVLLACAAPVIVSYFTYYVWRPSARNNYADLIQPTRGMPADLGLRRLDGTPVASASLAGQWLLVVVAGGDCDRRCEDHLYEQRQLREMTGRERDRVDRVWLVTDDAPLREPIAQAMTVGDAPATVLRAPRASLERWLQPAPGHALEDHLYLVDPMGEWMMRAPASLEPKRFYKDLDRLLRASAFWDRPGREAAAP
ncbi:hypothetical protein [Ideonella sp.]|uniref:hypothetical protein n=1 Tax=Ideonella sp. TaxID=1929293 RepID=UPI002B48AA9B|nr:hypothetical protein [Ideonella sp.]HJV67792.1 hypothetical protein [Ideonella sp.]